MKYCTIFVLQIISGFEVEIQNLKKICFKTTKTVLHHGVFDSNYALSLYGLTVSNKPIFFTLQPHDAYKMAIKWLIMKQSEAFSWSHHILVVILMSFSDMMHICALGNCSQKSISIDFLLILKSYTFACND